MHVTSIDFFLSNSMIFNKKQSHPSTSSLPNSCDYAWLSALLFLVAAVTVFQATVFPEKAQREIPGSEERWWHNCSHITATAWSECPWVSGILWERTEDAKPWSQPHRNAVMWVPNLETKPSSTALRAQTHRCLEQGAAAGTGRRCRGFAAPEHPSRPHCPAQHNHSLGRTRFFPEAVVRKSDLPQHHLCKNNAIPFNVVCSLSQFVIT